MSFSLLRGSDALKEVKLWLKSGAESLPTLSPDCTADISVSMVEQVLSSKSSYLVGILISALNECSLPDFLFRRGNLLILVLFSVCR